MILTPVAAAPAASDCSNEGINCEVDAFGTVSVGPNDTFFAKDTKSIGAHPETIYVIVKGYSKTSAYPAKGSCTTTEEKPVTLPTPYTWSRIGTTVQFSDEQLFSVAGFEIGRALHLETCIVVLRSTEVALITTTPTTPWRSTVPRAGATSSATNSTSTSRSARQASSLTTLTSATPTPQSTPSTSNPESTANVSTSPQNATIGSSSAAESDSPKRHVGLVVGLVVPLSLATLACWYVMWRKRRKFLGKLLSQSSITDSWLPTAGARTAGPPTQRSASVPLPTPRVRRLSHRDMFERPVTYGFPNSKRNTTRTTSTKWVNPITPISRYSTYHQELRGPETNHEMEG